MLTRYLIKYRRLSNMAMLKQHSLALRQVAVSLRFAYNIDHASDVIRAGDVCINGIPATMPLFQLYQYDVVSMRINYHNYALVAKNFIKSAAEIFKFYTCLMRIDEFRKRRLSYKKNAYNRYLYSKFEKAKLSKVERVYSSISDVPDYLELDYLTLSAVIIFEPNRVQDHDQIFVRHSAFSFLKMLN